MTDARELRVAALLPACPSCGRASATVALLTSRVLYALCHTCAHRWQVTREWSDGSAQVAKPILA